MHHANINLKKVGTVILISEKPDYKAKNTAKARQYCCECGCKLAGDNVIPKEIEWQQELTFVCPECGAKVEYSYNKAKNLTIMG